MAQHLYFLAHHLIKVKHLRARLLVAPGDASIGVEASCAALVARGAFIGDGAVYAVLGFHTMRVIRHCLISGWIEPTQVSS